MSFVWVSNQPRSLEAGGTVRETDTTITFNHEFGDADAIDTVYFVLSDNVAGDNIYIALDSTTDPTQVVFYKSDNDPMSFVTMSAADLVDLEAGTYYYEIRIIGISGIQAVVEQGTLDIGASSTTSANPTNALLSSYSSLVADNATNAAALAALQLSCCTVIPGLELQLIALAQTLTATASASATVLTISASGDFTAGDAVTVLLDSGVTFGTTVASVDDSVTITIDDPLPTIATSGNYVRFGADFTACLAGC